MLPSPIRAGDSYSWTDDCLVCPTSGVTYYPSSGYTLTWELRGPSTATVTASVSGAQWVSTISTTISGNLSVGLYGWAAVLTKTGERITVQSGVVEVLTNLAALATTYDPRSTAQVALDQARAALADFTANHRKIRSYTINNRSMTFESAADILQIVRYWEGRVAIEGQQESIAAGSGNPRRLHVRFSGGS